jgi:hypothetical protein
MVMDADNPYVRINYFVVNKRTGKGSFGNHKGQFKISVLKKDSLVFSSHDYYPVKVVVRDSCRVGARCQLQISMRKREIELRPVDILPIREHDQITKDIKNLIEPKKIERVTADAINSPITALYQMFSKIEREKHEVRVLEAEDKKRDVLKELLAKYVKAEIIDLEEEQFDDFLSTAEFDVEYLRTLSDYQLIKYVQYRYESYVSFMEVYNVLRRLEHNEYELMLLEAQGQRQAVITNIFKQFVDKDIWTARAQNPELIFEFINYANLNISELIELNDYALIVTIKRKYDQFRGVYGSGKY